MLIVLLIVAAGLGGLLVTGVSTSDFWDALPGFAVPAAVLAALLALYLATHQGGRGGRYFGRTVTMLCLVCLMAFAARGLHGNSPDAIAGFLAPLRSSAETAALAHDAPASVRIRRRADGSFLANAEINGEATALLIDSGAATVVLRHSDAEKIGIDMRTLAYNTPLKTANGTGYLAPTELKSVRIGPIVLNDVEALVAKPGTLNESLLGMSFLRRLTSYQVAGNFATLRR